MRLNQVTVPALDVAKSIAFYKTLGMRLIVESPHYARFELPDGEATFSIHLTTDAGRAADGAGIYFECDDLDAKVAALKAQGIAFDHDPVDQSWLWREAWLTGPAGERLCLYKAGEARRYPPWRVKD